VHFGETIEFRELAMTYTVPQDLAGLPACVVRAGFDHLGIPIGVQVTGAVWADAEVLRAAQGLWQATPEIQDQWPMIANAVAAISSSGGDVENPTGRSTQ
jgi:aspartyl-tRNA(Asn)/glutamyl-tRNA(Gln) amidotransferase subunit A